MKTMIMPLYANVILRPYEKNPYVEMTSKEGLILTDDQFNSQDSGEVEKLDLMIGCAEIVDHAEGHAAKIDLHIQRRQR